MIVCTCNKIYKRKELLQKRIITQAVTNLPFVKPGFSLSYKQNPTKRFF